MVFLRLDNEQQTEIDLTGAITFIVIQHPGSFRWVVKAIMTDTTREVITYGTRKDAHTARLFLNKHVVEEGVNVQVHPDTGSIVPL